MIRSMDILARNFDVLRLKQENLSANAANVTTPGFKYQTLVQSALAAATARNQTAGANGNQLRELGSFTFGNQVDESVTFMNPGSLQETGRTADLALIGEGFFTIDGPNGIMYTKNGQFNVNEAGQLVTVEGYPVQMRGSVVFDHTTTINQNGLINHGEAELIISSFDPNNGSLTNIEGGYFTGADVVQNDRSTILYQGYLETANVEIADIMVEMMQITREYEANQKVLQATNETLEKATNQVGRV